jgi:hypothetical protein
MLQTCKCAEKNSALLDRLPAGWYEITHAVAADFVRNDVLAYYGAADKVAAAHRRWVANRLTKAMYEEICKSEGMTYHELALPWRMSLRNTLNWFGTFKYDWVHTMLQEGPMQITMFLYLETCRDFVWFPEVRDWLSLPWVFPTAFRTKGNCLWKIFSEWRSNKDGDHQKLTCSCSELLGCYSLVRSKK